MQQIKKFIESFENEKIRKELGQNTFSSVGDLYVKIVYGQMGFDLNTQDLEFVVRSIVSPIKKQLVLSSQMKQDLEMKKRHSLPEFRRQEWFRYKRLGDKWRRPRGIHSKLRRKFGYRPPMVSVGYRTKRTIRGLHPSGYSISYASTISEMKNIERSSTGVMIRGTVGTRRRRDLERYAIDNQIYVINRRQVPRQISRKMEDSK